MYPTPVSAQVPARAPIPVPARVSRDYLPLKLIMGYLVTVFVLFVIWPINWPIYDTFSWVRLIVYVSACFSALAGMFVLGARGAVLPPNFRSTRRVVLIGAVAAVGLLVPLSYLYAGRGPWEIMSALADQSATYNRGVEQAFARDTGGRVASLISALAGPFIFAVIPFGVIYWRNLTLLFKGAVVAAVLSAIIMSIMRGTDREIATSLIVAISALMVSIRRAAGVHGTLFQWMKRHWKAIIFVALAFYLAAGIFTTRKADRLGTTDRACTLRNTICADQDAPVLRLLNERTRFGISFFILTVAQGFYGLELGLEKDFKPTWGVGHSPAILSIYTNLSGDDSMYERAYTTRNGFEGWSDQNYWSSMLLWIANDVGFFGVIIVLAVLGFLWGRAWRDATYGRSDPAAVMFCVIMLMLFYLPANNQVFTTLDGYTTFFGWLIVWQLGKIRAAKERGVLSDDFDSGLAKGPGSASIG